MMRDTILFLAGITARLTSGLEVCDMRSRRTSGQKNRIESSRLAGAALIAGCLLLVISLVSTAGASGFALEFDGQDDYVVTNEQYPFINETGEFCASAWVFVHQHAVSTDTWNSVMGRGHAGPFRVAVITDGQVRCTWDGETFPGDRVDLYSDPIAEYEWTHVLVQGDGSTLRMYVDGTMVDETAIVPGPQESVEFAIGTWPERLGQRVMNGVIDDVRLWNRPLMDDEIGAAMDEELTGQEAGLVGYWNFNEGQGEIAYDSSTTANSGTIAGATWTTNAAPFPPPAIASNPSPVDGMSDVLPDASLSWAPGVDAIEHDIYLGTTFEDVNEASRANPLDVLVSQGQVETTYDPAALVFGQTYYWRVDEVADPPESGIHKGTVWSFTVEPAGYPVASQRVIATASSVNSAEEGPENTINGSGLNDQGRHSVEPNDMWLSGPAEPGTVSIEYAFDMVSAYALEFDGQDDYVVTNEPYPFINETGQFSTSAWVNVNQHAVSVDTWNSVVGRGHAGPYRVVVITDGQVRCTWDGASRVNLYSDPIAENEWTHIVVQGDGSALQMYIDGVLADETDITPAPQDSPNFAIGTYPDNLGQRVMDGIIDDVRVWTRPLTEAEIQAAMEEELSGREEGLVGYWRFDEGEGTVARDHSPRQNHGTIAGASWTTTARNFEAAGSEAQGPVDPVKLHQMLVWNHNTSVEPLVGFGVKDATVEYSLDGVDWTALDGVPEFARATGKDSYAANTAVDFDGALAKYVRITANSNWSGVLNQYGLSEVQFLAVPMAARNPEPASGAMDVSPKTALSWRAGRGAAIHDVYLSTDEQAVVEASAPVQTVSDPRYEPALNLGTTYYWKVNEVNEAADPSVWQGDVWTFSTVDHLVVDDFESYNAAEDQGTRVYEVWVDGFDDPDNGSIVGYDGAVQGTFGETTIVYGGRQSMPLFYENTGGAVSAEARRTFDEAQDWTRHGITTLVVYFHGAADNTGQLYLEINGTRVPYEGDALTLPKWTQWNIDLASLNAGLDNVSTLTFGVEGAGASGVIYLDDVLLYAEAPAIPETVWLEAEGGSVTAPTTVIDNAPDASGGQYVSVPPLTNSTDEPPADGLVTIPFTVEGGTYRVEARVIAPTDGDDSMWMRIPGATTNTANHASGWIQADVDETVEWGWSEIRSIDDGNAVVVFTLAAGMHDLELTYREDGLQIDAFQITAVD